VGGIMFPPQPRVERIAHMVDVARPQPRMLQTEFDGTLGELVRVVDARLFAVLDAVEPFLLGGGDERAVDQHRRGGFVIDRVDSQNVHRLTRTFYPLSPVACPPSTT